MTACQAPATIEITVERYELSYVLARTCDRHLTSASATIVRSMPERLRRANRVALVFTPYVGPFHCES